MPERKVGNMDGARKWGQKLARRGAAYRALLLGLSACGGAVSTGERWDPDGVVQPLIPATEDLGGAVQNESPPCADERLSGYDYADPPGFWLGSQAERGVEVTGAGFFASDDALAERHAVRFSRRVALSVGPEGALEDRGGHALLGYPPHAVPGGPCVIRLLAPIFTAPQATTHISIRMNIDPRQELREFDLNEPEQTSNSSTSMSVFDSQGDDHVLEIYFNNLGGNVHNYSVLADGSEIFGGTSGYPVLLGQGQLQFTSDGALDTTTLPPLDINFLGNVTPNQAVSIDFGTAIADGGSGYEGTTSFATASFVSSQSQDGYPMGTGDDVSITPSGDVTVTFDNGAALVIGKLALARFPNEDRLTAEADGSLRSNAQSGPAQFGAPSGPGRGSLAVAALP
jgi:flagellar hook protein FlgE